mgnify:CR=1 FL=1|jgi:hypothetical protein|tara:strand:+ start:423 stop:680 length:258 start_codon:yes stop_codon:yes gene_type:complete
MSEATPGKLWKKGHVWTKKHLLATLRLVDVRNFAKRKKAGLTDDVHDLHVWAPMGDSEMKAFLTGYYGAMDDLEKWVMEQVEDGQ